MIMYKFLDQSHDDNHDNHDTRQWTMQIVK